MTNTINISRRKVAALTMAVAASAMSASARSLLYYYDFDTVQNGALVYTGVNNGTGSTEMQLKTNGSNPPGPGYVANGAFGSSHAFSASAVTSLWLGDGSASLGCNTTSGFTISFWLKASGSHVAWNDFFGFKVGGTDYRCEYIEKNSSKFRMYYNTSSSASKAFSIKDGSEYISQAEAGKWAHVAFVFKPDKIQDAWSKGSGITGNCYMYINGNVVATVSLDGPGDLQRIYIGSLVPKAPYAENTVAFSRDSQTLIDELAVFDYPATDEHVKWLLAHKPAQPADGPGRTMPLAWRFERQQSKDKDGEDNGVWADNCGTGGSTAYKWDTSDTYARFSYGDAVGNTALGTSRSFLLNTATTFRTDNTASPEGLGATLGSGMSLSFWIKAPASISNPWGDFISMRIGDRYGRLEWADISIPTFRSYGSKDTTVQNGEIAVPNAVWHHVGMVWNNAESKMEFWFDGNKHAAYLSLPSPNPAEALKSLTVGGGYAFNESGSKRNNTKRLNAVYIDEVAIFNHSLSPEQIQWLTNNVPCLPPLDATNLVRAVSANGAWAGGIASWTVREWDDANEAWANTTRTTIYPALEDTEVEVTLTLADGVELTNDTFVTPKRLVLVAATESAAATLKSTVDSRFAPQALEICDGLQLTVPLYAVNVGGTLTFGTDSKIVFDVSNFYDGGTTNALSVGAFALPAGETSADVLSHFGVTDNRYTISLSADGKTVIVDADTVPVVATWTGAGDGTSLGSAVNWECRNASGGIVADALPCDRTRVIISSGTVAMNAPVGTVLPWQYLSIEAGSATLPAATDWRGLPSLAIPEGVTVSLGGFNLYLNNAVTGKGTFTDTAATGGELHFDIPNGVTFENEVSGSHATRSFPLAGTLKVVKDGAGVFVASRFLQSYSGGTYVAAGTLKYGHQLDSRILGAAVGDITVSEYGIIDINGYKSSFEHLHVLNGGKMLNSRADINAGNAQIGNVRLGANSSFDVPHSWGMVNTGFGAQTLDLGGYTLSVDVSPNIEFYLFNTEIKNGLFDLTRGGWLVTGLSSVSGTSNNDIVATNADFRVNAALKLYATIKARNYEAVYSSNSNEGTAVFEVYGTFKPSVHDYFRGCKMMDGSTIDLSARTNALPHIAAFTNGAKTLDFEPNKTVYVKLGSRNVSCGEAIISWSAKPADIDTVKFTSVPGEQACGFIKKDDGLYITRGTTIIFY